MRLKVDANRILYVGDSLKLDIIPALSIGVDAWMIDRDPNFCYFTNGIESLVELNHFFW